jgi:hypothetical protein
LIPAKTKAVIIADCEPDESQEALALPPPGSAFFVILKTSIMGHRSAQILRIMLFILNRNSREKELLSDFKKAKSPFWVFSCLGALVLNALLGV